jgi:hypothetical protein
MKTCNVRGLTGHRLLFFAEVSYGSSCGESIKSIVLTFTSNFLSGARRPDLEEKWTTKQY